MNSMPTSRAALTDDTSPPRSIERVSSDASDDSPEVRRSIKYVENRLLSFVDHQEELKRHNKEHAISPKHAITYTARTSYTHDTCLSLFGYTQGASFSSIKVATTTFNAATNTSHGNQNSGYSTCLFFRLSKLFRLLCRMYSSYKYRKRS